MWLGGAEDAVALWSSVVLSLSVVGLAVASLYSLLPLRHCDVYVIGKEVRKAKTELSISLLAVDLTLLYLLYFRCCHTCI